jgi:hypothetical protein
MPSPGIVEAKSDINKTPSLAFVLKTHNRGRSSHFYIISWFTSYNSVRKLPSWRPQGVVASSPAFFPASCLLFLIAWTHGPTRIIETFYDDRDLGVEVPKVCVVTSKWPSKEKGRRSSRVWHAPPSLSAPPAA